VGIAFSPLLCPSICPSDKIRKNGDTKSIIIIIIMMMMMIIIIIRDPKIIRAFPPDHLPRITVHFMGE